MSEPEVKQTTRPTLLVADDETDLLGVFEEFMKDDFDLELAQTGTDAIERIRARHHDVIVTDINMPGADGLTVLRVAKEVDPETEVVMLTGNASTLTAIEALREGAYDYVLKPFDLYEMDQTIQKALERRTLRAENRRIVSVLQEANEELRRNQEELRRHRDELESRVAEATRRIRTLYEVGQEITSNLRLDHTLDLILERSMELAGSAEGALFLAPETGGELRCRACRGLGAGDPAAELTSALGELHGLILGGRRAESGSVRLAGGERRHALVVPFLREGEVSGTLAVFLPSDRTFATDEVETLSGLAAQGSIAIHNAVVYEKIRELDRLKSEFVAVVSHELRTPLTAIKGTLEILGTDRYFPQESQQRELLAICQANADRLEALVNDILDHTKLESSRLSTDFVVTHLGSLVAGVQVNLTHLAVSKRIRLRTECDETAPPVRADEMRLAQVLTNLVGNAVKFSHPETDVVIRVVSEAGGTVVKVTDQGIGIAPEDLPKLFSRFHQLDSSTTRRAGGTGLGLVISKGIIDEHGGRIWAESVPGQGSTFSFWLPAATADAGSTDPSASSRSEGVTHTAA
jgi:signal transduction histidine kinase/DNA-binding response OmpR family regulator